MYTYSYEQLSSIFGRILWIEEMIFILVWTKQKDVNETVSVLILSFINLNEVKKTYYIRLDEAC